MAHINFKDKVIDCKIVYYGPGRSGKTTNLKYIFSKYRKNTLGEMVSINTKGDRTLFFDFLPLGLGKVNGCEIKVQLFTVPGQPQYSSTRKMVLKGVDGIVFVADSLKVRHKENLWSLKDLNDNLVEQNKKISKMPLVFQYNKQDLTEKGLPIIPVKEMDRCLNNQLKVPSFSASALTGKEVGATLLQCIKLTVRNLYREYMEAEMSNKIALSGDLQFISLADVFQILGGSNRSGTLKLMGSDGLSEGIIYFVDGNPINATNGSLYGIEAINKMFGWMEARFEFCDERVHVEPIINLGSMRIVLDALRLMDEGSIEIVGNESGSSNFHPNQLSVSKNSVIKGPPIDYAYFLDEERFADRTKILGEGDEGNWLWVILEGTVRVSRETKNGPITLGLLGEGSFIGTFTSFEYWKNARFATVTAVGNVCLGVLDSVALCARFCGLSRDFQKLLLGLSSRMKKMNDRMVPPSSQYQPADMLPDRAASMLEEKSLSHEAFIITNGEAYLFGKEEKSDQLLIKLEKGDVLGKLPFYDIGQEPHGATVIASKDLETQKINTDNIMKEYARLPRVLRNMINNVSTCVAKTTLDFLHRDGVSDAAGTENRSDSTTGLEAYDENQ